MMKPFRLQSLQGLRQSQLRFSRQTRIAAIRCPVHQLPKCRWSSTDSSGSSAEKPYYITTPIFYVNAAPHIGHLYSMILTDVLKRWQKLQGKEAYLCTGTDEHGMKIQRAAAKEGIPPKEFCDANSQKFKDLALEANISNDFFIRTTDAEHKRAVEEFWLHMKNGLPEDMGLYKGTHAGWYCVSDECFYPEDMVQSSVVPQTGRKIMSSIETGNEVEWVEEETWMFPLTKYKDQLLRFYDENPEFITPPQKMNEVRAWVENHLEDLSITRPASRLSWGIPDPEDKSNTIYVWVDALINYMTKSGYPAKWQASSADKGLWPADVHVVGKDIVRFHAIYWPAMLMSLSLPLPKKILCHNHWTMSNRKMSKSLGNVVDPIQAIQRWDIDPLRYFLMRNGSLRGDMSYSNDLVMTVYEKDLAANIGNLFNRISKARGSRWSTKEAVQYASNGDFKDIARILKDRTTKPLNVDALALQKSVGETVSNFVGFMNEMLPNRALGATFDLLSETNRFISDTEPWSLVKESSPDSRIVLNWIIFNCAESLRISGLLLQPIMPDKADQLLSGLGVDPSRRTLEWAEYGRDMEYGAVASKEKVMPKLARWISLFPPVAGMGTYEEAIASGDPFASVSPKKRMNLIVETLAKEAKSSEKEIKSSEKEAKSNEEETFSEKV